jgi:hypothetical protein
MQLQAKQTVYLVTAEKRPIGQIVIERSEEDCFFWILHPSFGLFCCAAPFSGLRGGR